MRRMRKLLGIVLVITMMLLSTSCGAAQNVAPAAGTQTESSAAKGESVIDESAAGDEQTSADKSSAEEPAAEKNGEVMILYTSDIHCGINQGFGLAGLKQIRDSLEAQGYTTILVDDGDAIQGEMVGVFTNGERMIDLMNAMQYDVAIPGNHEFDYGMEQFLALTEKAEFPYISCNFVKNGEKVFAPYVIKEAAGIKIAFVGITTPETITSSTPKYFQNEEGEFIYGFMQDETGEALYQAVQKAVDDARAEGADYVYVMAHLGLLGVSAPYTYVDVISHTSGIDVFLDGHSHDTDQVIMKNKDGEDVVRSAVGTKMNSIGHSLISPEKGVIDTAIWSWPNKDSAPSLLNIRNEMADKVDAALAEVDEAMSGEVGSSAVDLTIFDPNEKDTNGNPIRMVRRAETNLGDLCADAVRNVTGADIGIFNGGGVRTSISKGKITLGSVISVHPFGNEICMVEVTGQQILDALEWASSAVPDEMGGFMQVSGMTYEIDVAVPSGCQKDENNMFAGIEGERRVKNVMIGGEPIDSAKTYTLAGTNYTLLAHGDGQTGFDGATLLENGTKLDYQVLIEYIEDHLGGEIGEEYADPYGQGRIKILNG